MKAWQVVGKTLTFVALTFLSGSVGNAGAYTFDPDGPGGDTVIQVDAFDWLPGNAVIFGALPAAEYPGSYLSSQFIHASLGSFTNGGRTVGGTTLGDRYDHTFVAGVGQGGFLLGNTLNFSSVIGSPSFFEMYFRTLSQGFADGLSGAGFADGKLIARGVIEDMQSGPTISSDSAVAFDQFSSNNYPLQLTRALSGAATMTVKVDWVDPDFFVEGGSRLLFHFNTSLVAPFRQTDPSASFVVGGAADGHPMESPLLGAVNGDLLKGGPDLQFQADANMAIEVAPCTGAIGDFVWNDLHGNGIQDAGEPGIDGLTVTLVGSGGTATTMTGTNPVTGLAGYYQFTDLCAGDYTVTVETPTGFGPTATNAPGSTPADDSNSNPASVTLPQGGSDQTIDFGFVALCEGSIGDFIWNDLNKNGIQDAGEAGINGVEVTLAGPGGTATTTSGPNGYYQFSNLCAGTYTVTAGTPSGFTPTTANAPGSTAADDSNLNPTVVTLPYNGSDQTIDFGFVVVPTDGGGIYPTGTTCQQFLDSSYSELGNLGYAVNPKTGKITQDVTPGAFFYFSKFTTSAPGSQTVSMVQDSTPDGYEFTAKGNQVQLFNAACSSLSGVTVGTSGGNATISANIPAGTYYVRVGYDSKSIAGKNPPAGGTASYIFSTYLGGNPSPVSEATGFTLQPK